MRNKKFFLLFFVFCFVFTLNNGAFSAIASGATAWYSYNGSTEKAVKPKVEILSQNEKGLTLDITTFGFEHRLVDTKKGTFCRIDIPEAGQNTEWGHPRLPVIRETIEIPYQAEIKVELIEAKVSEFKLAQAGIQHALLPVQQPVPKIQNAAENIPFEMETKIYQSDKYYPVCQIRVADTYVIRGHRMALIEFYPITYNPAQTSIRFHSQAKVKIEFEGGDIAFTKEKIQRYQSAHFEKLISKIALNYGQFETSSDAKGWADLPVGYIIICKDDFETAVQPLADWKTQKGYDVTVATLTETGSTAAQIQSYIQNAYDTWPVPPDFVFLMGDTDSIPCFTGATSSTATDLYYATVDDDDPDEYLPDIGVARYTAQDLDDITNYFNKLLNYEKMQWIPYDWIKQICFIATCDQYDIAEGTHNYVIDTYTNPKGYTGIFPNNPEAGGDKIYCITYDGDAGDITNAVNDGRVIVNYSGHGYSGGWGDGQVSYSQADVQALVNYGMYPFVISNACSTNPFNLDDCYGETWVRIPGKGGIAFWGASASSYWDEDDILERVMYDGWYTEGLNTLEEMTDYGQWGVYNYYGGEGLSKYYFEVYNVLGDPALDLFNAIPQTITAVYPGTIVIGQNQVSFSVSSGGSPIEKANVSLQKTGEVQEAGQTNAAGEVTITMVPPPVSPGLINVTITAHNYLPHYGTIQVVPASGPFVAYNSSTVNDDNSGSSSGDNDGIVDVGETIELAVTLINYGSETAFGVSAQISSANPYVASITSDTQTYGDIAPSGTATSAAPYVITFVGNAPDGVLINFTLEITDSGSGSWTDNTLSLTLRAPELEYINYTIDDSAGNNNGKVDPGETITLPITLANNGGQDAFNVSGTISESSEWVTMLDNSADWLNIAPAAQANTIAPHFSFQCSANTPPGTSVTFDLNISAAGGYSMTDSFAILIGQKPILLVDDDGGDSYQTAYATALDNLGYSYDIYTISSGSDGPSFEVMEEYLVVIWLTGYDMSSTLTAADQSNLTQYLNQEGRFFLCGQDILYDTGISTFVQNYLHLVNVNNDANASLAMNGYTGNYISDGMSLTLSYPYTNYADVITKDTLPNTENTFYSSDGVAAVNYHQSIGNTGYRIVFLTFPFEAITNQADPNNQNYVMDRIYHYLTDPIVPVELFSFEATMKKMD